MNHSGDAAEQIVRLSLEGVEIVAKIAGAGAKNIATFLFAALKNKDSNKLKGKSRLTSMLKSSKPLQVFAIKETDLKKFASEAKRYGVVYCALRHRKGSPDGLCDVMVRQEDAHKINRIVERFEMSKVDKAKLENEIVSGKEKQEPERNVPDNDVDKLLDDFLSDPKKKEQNQTENPNMAKTEKAHRSEPTSKNRPNSVEGVSDKSSVKEDIKKISANQKKEAATKKQVEKTETKKTPQKQINHKQPKRKRKKER